MMNFRKAVASDQLPVASEKPNLYRKSWQQELATGH
jgi:hypothetical protein